MDSSSNQVPAAPENTPPQSPMPVQPGEASSLQPCEEFLSSVSADQTLDSPQLPPAPVPPAPSDCCGSGCVPCVMDIYDQEVAMWKLECNRIKRGDNNDKKNGRGLSSDQYTEFCIEEIERESTDSCRYRFSVPGGQKLPLAVGQHLIMRWRGDEGIVTRQYTPVVSDYGYFDMVIKVYPEGRMSQYVRDWKIGDRVEWRGPMGALAYSQNQYSRILLLAAGTGIAPMVPLIRHIVHNDHEDTIISLIYSCHSYQDVLCKNMLDDFSSYWNFSVNYIVTGAQGIRGAKIKYGDKVETGRLNKAELEKYLSYDKVFICGTRQFDADMIVIMKEVGYSEEQLHKF